MAQRFNKDYDHFAEHILEQCGFKDNLFEDIAKNITQIMSDTAETHTLSQTIQKLEDKIINDKSGILLRFFTFTATMAFVDLISRNTIVQEIGKILENLPVETCTKCEHMKKRENGEGYICEKTLEECPIYSNLSDKDKATLASIQPKK